MPIELTPTKIDDKPQIHEDDLSPIPPIPQYYISTQNPIYNNEIEKSPEQHAYYLREHSNNTHEQEKLPVKKHYKKNLL